MVIVRIILFVFGMGMTVVGCYLVAIGFGVPVEELSVELSGLKLKANNLGAGIFFAVVGLIVIWLAAKFLKKEVTTTEYTQPFEGGADDTPSGNPGTLKTTHVKMGKVDPFD